MTNLNKYSTKNLIEELINRDGVEYLTVAPHEKYQINIEKDWDDKRICINKEGITRILIIND